MRSLRDRFGRSRLTTAGRAEISEALNRAGIAMKPGLERASLEDQVLLRLRRRDGAVRGKNRIFSFGSRAWKVAVGAVSLLATLVGLYAFFRAELRDEPVRHLGGDLNLAVAPFTGTGSDAARQGQQLAQQVRTTLGQQLHRREQGTDVTFDVAPPPPLKAVTGATAGEQTAAAARAARRINANVLVYGTVRVTQTSTLVAPRFYIAGQALGNAEELVGSHRLGNPLTISGSVADSVAARIDARRFLATRARVLADFVVGLSYFEQRDYQMASRWFHQAERGLAAAGGGAGEVIYLFLGHAAGRSGDFARAQRFYAKALAVDPGYGRAQFGMAEVRFQRAHGGCRPGRADAGALRAALRGFQIAEEPSQPYAGLLKVRASFGRARVLLCLSMAGIEPRWGEAEALFRQVIGVYERGEPRLRDEASEALASLGLIHLPSPTDRARGRRLRQAAVYYRRALALSPDATRKAVFSSMLGFIYGKLGQVAAADQAYREAIQLDPDAADRRRYEEARRALMER